MAIYHLSVKTISRSAGRSATGAAAYRSGQEITDSRSGVVHDYTRKQGVEHTELIAPDPAPAWTLDRSSAWNAAEQAETRKNSTVAREVEVALPAELDAAARILLACGFAREIVAKHGCIADVCIHAPSHAGNDLNHHAHILLSTRRIGPEGFGEKTREWDAKQTGSQLVTDWRAEWAASCNRALEQAGKEQRVDHRSLKEQQTEAANIANDPARAPNERQEAEGRAVELAREPQAKLGVAATAMERRGIRTERGDVVRAVNSRNLDLARLRAELMAASVRIIALGREIASRTSEMVRNASHIVVGGAARAMKAAVLESSPETPAQLYARMNADELRALIEKMRPRPVVDLVQMHPAMVEAVREQEALKTRFEKRQSHLQNTRDEIQAWRSEHPKLAWLHDNKFVTAEALDSCHRHIEKNTEALVQDREKLYASKLRVQRLWEDLARDVVREQAHVRKMLTEMEAALRPKEMQERIDRIVREAGLPDTNRAQHTGIVIKVDDTHVWQDIGRSAVMHERAGFGVDVPKFGEEVRVRYCRGAMSVERHLELSRGRGHDTGR